MAMSDCAECWDTPCTCGHDYKGMDTKKRLEIARAACPPGYEVVKKSKKVKEPSSGKKR